MNIFLLIKAMLVVLSCTCIAIFVAGYIILCDWVENKVLKVTLSTIGIVLFLGAMTAIMYFVLGVK